MTSPAADKSDILNHAGRFDPDWYQARYGDVTAQTLLPRDHFLAVGHLLGRGISAAHPTLDSLPGLGPALSRQPLVSYCIPVMNRLDDLQATLARNLNTNRAHQDAVEFIVLDLNADDQTATWVRSHFDDDLRCGYLRLVRAPPLPSWHFGKAKNGFRRALSGRLYSSLDADNTVTAAETAQLLSAQQRFGDMFVFHHFGGTWGDGSSGRITLPARVYRKIGYDPGFLPRQFDEVDLILSALVAYPGLVLLRHQTDRQVLGSDTISAFLRIMGCKPNVHLLPQPNRVAPQNPKPADYVQSDPATHAMQAYNEAWCFLKNWSALQIPRDPPEVSRWRAVLQHSAQDCVAHLPPADLPRLLFGTDLPALPAGVSSDILCLTRPDDVLPAPPEGQMLFVIDARAPLGQTPSGSVLPEQSPPDPNGGGLCVLIPQVGHPDTAEALWVAGLARALNHAGLARALNHAGLARALDHAGYLSNP